MRPETGAVPDLFGLSSIVRNKNARHMPGVFVDA